VVPENEEYLKDEEYVALVLEKQLKNIIILILVVVIIAVILIDADIHNTTLLTVGIIH
jgi:hypothetical protein